MKDDKRARQLRTYRRMCGAMQGRDSARRGELELRHEGEGRVALWQAGRRVMLAVPGEGFYFESSKGWGDAFCEWMEDVEASEVAPGSWRPAALVRWENEEGLPYYTCEDFEGLVVAPETYEEAEGVWAWRDRWGVALAGSFQFIYEPKLTLAGAEKLARAMGAVGDIEDEDEDEGEALRARLGEAVEVLKPLHLADWRDAEIWRRQNAPARSPLTGRFKNAGVWR